MDHSHMNHGDMGHGDMGGGMEDMCSMNVSASAGLAMIFTWDYNNLCVIFRWWHIRSFGGLLISLIAIVALCAGYEAVRAMASRFDTQSAAISAQQNQRAREDDANAEDGLLVEPGTFKAGSWAGDSDRHNRTVKGIFYAVQVFYSFFIMLLFMTYNGWIMLAVPMGAFLGYMLFGGGSAQKSQACH